MGGSGGSEAYRAMARQEQARQRKLEERRQQRAEQVKARHQHGADGARIEETAAEDGEELACPTCHLRFDFGMRCPDCEVMLVGVSFLTGQPPPREVVEHTGPRYACEKCGHRGDSADRCEKCDHWELLDLQRASDRRFDAVLKAQRRQRRRHAISAFGVLSAVGGLVVLLLGTVYVAPPALIIGLIMTLSGGIIVAGGPVDL